MTAFPGAEKTMTILDRGLRSALAGKKETRKGHYRDRLTPEKCSSLNPSMVSFSFDGPHAHTIDTKISYLPLVALLSAQHRACKTANK
jgi:hypothetical protein